MKRTWILHPFLFAIYPVVSLLAFNLGKLKIEEAIRSLLITLILAALLVLLAKTVIKDWLKASLLASLLLTSFFLYTHLTRSVIPFLPEQVIQYKNILFPSIGAVVIGCGGWFIIFRLKKVNEINNILNVIILAGLTLPSYEIISFVIESRNLSKAFIRTEHVEINLDPLASEQLPDIYFILLDGYTRQDTLLELYDYDNSKFLNYLANKGFYVPRHSPTNYVKTMFVLSASFNARYLDDMAEQLGPKSINLIPLQKSVQSNDVVDALSAIGYRIINISTGFNETDLADADIHLQYDLSRPNEFESMLLRNTPISSLVDRIYKVNSFYALHRARVMYAVEQLQRMPEEPGPKLVFAHILLPHPPFVFGPDGEEVNLDAEPEDHYFLPAKTYIPAYRNQVNYANQLSMNFIDRILENSVTPPIIILQGDHGPRLYLGKTPDNTCLMERFTIFNSFYFPDGNYERLYDSISPVNTFRVIFDQYFGTNLGVLEDRTYHSVWPRLFDFKDVSNHVNTCTLPGS